MVTTLKVSDLKTPLFVKLQELEDFHWFPAILRKHQMELIGILVSFFGFYRKIADTIKKEMVQHHIHHATDLCSGSGSPAVYVFKRLSQPGFSMELTDKFPQQVSLPSGMNYIGHPVDVHDLLPKADRYYTMFNAFHHFDKDEQQKMIQKFLDHKSHLVIVEIVQPTLLHVVLVTLASTLGVWLLCPLIRPFDYKRLILTYLIPINVLTVLTDGYISILKSRTERQYKQDMAEMFENTNRIQVSSQWSFPAQLIIIKVSPDHV